MRGVIISLHEEIVSDYGKDVVMSGVREWSGLGLAQRIGRPKYALTDRNSCARKTWDAYYLL